MSNHLRKYFTPLPSSFLGDVTNVLSYDPSLEIMLLCPLLPLLLLLLPLLVTQGAPTPLTASLLWAATLDLHDSYKEVGTLLLSLWCEALDVPHAELLASSFLFPLCCPSCAHEGWMTIEWIWQKGGKELTLLMTIKSFDGISYALLPLRLWWTSRKLLKYLSKALAWRAYG